MACVGWFDKSIVWDLGVRSRSSFPYVFHLNEHELHLASVLMLKDVIYTATNQLLSTPQVRRAES